MNDLYKDLYEYISSLRVINTHCHHRETEEFKNFSLSTLIENSYVSWCGVDFDSSRKSRENFLSKVRHRSYFFWLRNRCERYTGSTDR